MNVIFTCGGTAGHVNPAIAVANIWMERHPESKILFIGGEDEMERDLVLISLWEPVAMPAFLHFWQADPLSCLPVSMKAMHFPV